MSITVTDMFCGCGGSSSGAAAVDGVRVQLAMNHWRLAVESHNHNHPDTDHDCADISETHPARYRTTTGLVASPECTNHSLAKGARRTRLDQGDFFQSSINPAEVRSRATMWDVVRFAEHHRYAFVVTENVVDVRRWALFEPWLAAMHALGYAHRCVYLNAMFAHGAGIGGFAPQSRDRIYVVFWRKGNRAPDLDVRPKAPCGSCERDVEAVQAWKPGRTWGKYRTQYLYRCPACAGEVKPYFYAALCALDLSLPGERIGDRRVPLRPKTLARIEYGLEKFGLRELVVETAYSHAPANRALSGEAPLPTATARGSHALVRPFLQANRAGSTARSLGEAMHTLTTGTSGEYLVSPSALLTMRGPRHLSGLADALPAQVTTLQNAVVSGAAMLTSYYGQEQATLATAGAMGTLTTRDRHALAYAETLPAPNVEDLFFRMLQPHEMLAGQGFAADYVVLGNKTERVKQIGNANPPPTMQLLVERCAASLAP